jgi:hypothetical protein
MLIRIRHLPFGLFGIVILGIAIGLKLEPWVGWRAKLPQIILMGSGNVHPFLQTHVPGSDLSRMDTVWVDAGSGVALENAFSVFNYGRSVNVDTQNRVGFVAMSSYGSHKLADLLKSNEAGSAQKDQNWFLSILIANRPLTIFYRDINQNQLKIRNGDRLPQELGSGEAAYQFLRITDLKDIVENPQMEGVTRYLPEANSGTRFLFEAAAKGNGWGSRVNWANVTEVPDYLDAINEKSSFLELASELQVAHAKDSSSSCERLHKHKIKAAMICTGLEPCEHIVPAEYVIVIKLERNTGKESKEFRIPNGSECRIAHAFAKDDVLPEPDCSISATETQLADHIVTLNHPAPGLPEYLACSN